MPFTITPVKITKTFDPAMLDFLGSVVSTAGASDSCSFTITASDSDVIVLVSNKTFVSGSDIEVAFTKGQFWAAKDVSGSGLNAKPGMVAAYAIDSAMVKAFDGTITMTLKPANETKSLMALGVSVAVLEIVRANNN